MISGGFPLLEHDEEILLGRQVQRLMEIKECEELLGRQHKNEQRASLDITRESN